MPKIYPKSWLDNDAVAAWIFITQDLGKNSLQLLFLGALGVLGGSFFHDFA